KQKVVLSAANGARPFGRLTLYNNKLYGMCMLGGANGKGSLFEYLPDINGFIKRHDFDGVNGSNPRGGLTIHNNLLYGLTQQGGSLDSGILFAFDPVTNTLAKKKDLNSSTGTFPENSLSLLNDKLYGITSFGGSNNLGASFEYSTETGTLIKKADLQLQTAAYARTGELLAVPALVAPGSPNACINANTVKITAANASEWIAFTDAEGRAVAEINANGNVLGNTTVRFYINAGPTRKDGNGAYYLDRNINVTAENSPVSTVSIRLYIRKQEFEALKNTPGSWVMQPSDLQVFQGSDFCAAAAGSATKLASGLESWAADYVYTAEVSSLSSYYFAGNIHTALPVSLLQFSGRPLPASNELTWKADCIGDIQFTIERSTDGSSFEAIGLIFAREQDCSQPFKFNDIRTTMGRTYYRLRMREDDGEISYSGILVIDRTKPDQGGLVLSPNPVSGPEAVLNIQLERKTAASLSIIDMSGKRMFTRRLQLNAGPSRIAVDTGMLPAGVYLLVFEDEGGLRSIRFIKQ
ncbi:MAG TPA: T9SS type A sorting domain-containing protein, partial [Flavisolibacter sp.]|nr:T9SS type A sorting domain-containing protein [Flavisolibacter sp.]